MVRKTSAPSVGADADSSAGADSPRFEDALEELETLVERMEGGALSLEESLAAYKRGAELVAHCRKALADVQQQVKVLEGSLLKPFEPDQAQDDGG